ncbi:MAG TPA: orotidine-5'-phosphate decarboxylase [Gemmatimonadales bacterium]|jgi:orotidine-5'-phosphate decarboxylase|nr:orotidine-5'-phosphate decarboxylase [Gemmatimonadales bacterium]
MSEVILALDVTTAEEAERLLDAVPRAGWVKVGSVLLTREGGALTRRLVARGLNVFLDLKWHDIPNTVAGAVAQARDMGVAMATVHTLGGRQMMEAAAAAAGDRLALVGVTVLTSHDRASYGKSVGRGDVVIEAEVERLGREARDSGLAGIVCSPAEVGRMRDMLGEGALLVVPGIRRSGDRVGDQQRVATPAAASAAGATHLVVGRPVLEAADPASAFAAFVEEAGCTRL